jgi:hypothetical protein
MSATTPDASSMIFALKASRSRPKVPVPGVVRGSRSAAGQSLGGTFVCAAAPRHRRRSVTFGKAGYAGNRAMPHQSPLKGCAPQLVSFNRRATQARGRENRASKGFVEEAVADPVMSSGAELIWRLLCRATDRFRRGTFMELVVGQAVGQER